jgi:hypothetical protein
MHQALQAFNQTSCAGRAYPEDGNWIATGVVAGNVGGKDRIEYT